MNNFTTNTYELKREICNFSEKIANGISKPAKKFVMETQYGFSKGGSCLISNMARALDEDIKLNYTIDRLCDNFANLDDEYRKIIWKNYINEVKKNINPKDAIAIFDDSDINKEYSKKLEDLDRVRDASSPDKRIVNGYNVCEAVLLSKNTNQPISVYSKIYSCKSSDFKSKNTYTLDSIKAVENIVEKNFTGIFDRGYDDNKIFDYMDRKEHSFIVRLEDTRTLLFKDKKRSVEEVAKSRKGKIAMKVLFDDNEEYELILSYTRATLPYNKKEYTLVIVYGLNEDKPMKLLTNIKIENKEDVIKVVRLYLSRWRIEEHFRGKKQEYDFENMRVRTLKSMNNLNMLLTIHLGHIAILADKIDSKLLTIKIIYASKSLRSKTIVWLSQIARGMKEILKHAHEGIKRWQDIEVREPRQLSLKI
mgnify:FL=1